MDEGRRLVIAGLTATFVVAGSASAQPATQAPPPRPLIYFAGAPGRLTSDRDAQGGNPFASALVEVLAMKPLTLENFGLRLAAANARHSGGWHQAQLPRSLPDPKLRLDPQPGQTRVALVLINADYSNSTAYSLPGAAFDSDRVPAALVKAGFETTLVRDATAAEARDALARFSRDAETADMALVYVGGHGLQHRRTVYWMMGDYPSQDARWLSTHALSLDEISVAARARTLNLVLYASCRDDPFQ